MSDRLLTEATVFVIVVTSFQEALMQSMLILDLYDFRTLLMRPMCLLVLLRILSQSLLLSGIRMCFLEGPLVMVCTFALVDFLVVLIWCISIIFFKGKARNASQSLRRLLALTLVTWVNDFFFCLFSLLIFSTTFFQMLRTRCGGRGGGIFDTFALGRGEVCCVLGWFMVRVVLVSGVFKNLLATCCLNKVPSLELHLFQPALYMADVTVVPGPVAVFCMVYHYTKRASLTRL